MLEGGGCMEGAGECCQRGRAELGMKALTGCMHSQGARKARMFQAEPPPEALVIRAQLPQDGWVLPLAVLPESTMNF